MFIKRLTNSPFVNGFKKPIFGQTNKFNYATQFVK